jgi:hypothetical protein
VQENLVPAAPIVAQPDHEATCIVLAAIRGRLEDLLAGPGTPAACRADLQAALVLVKRAAGSNYVSWAAAPDEPEDWEPDFDDPYADEAVVFELTEAGLRAAAGVA